MLRNLSSPIRFSYGVKDLPLTTLKQVTFRNLHKSVTCAPTRLQSQKFVARIVGLHNGNIQLWKSAPVSYVLSIRSESTSSAEPVLSSSGDLHTSPISASTESTPVLENPAETINTVHIEAQTSTPEIPQATSQQSPPLNLESTSSEDIILDIPEPPSVPVSLDEFFTSASPLVEGEPALSTLGLAGWSPSGIAQQCLEFFHVGFGFPWWASILTGTIIVRVLLFPLVVKSQRNAAKMANNMPQIQLLQVKMTEARQSGNALLAAKYGNDMMMFMKEKEISPFKSMLVPLAMAPVFMSFFFGLRGMANLPVESMKTGGLMWFTDLTLADPYYILPLITSVTMWITLEIGVDGTRLSSSPHGNLMKYFMRGMPIIMFPFTMNFPAAILCYWVSTNAVSLVQVSTLKIPAIRQKLNIEALRPISADDLPVKNEGFVKSFKNSWTNIKITKEMEERERHDDVSFKRSGRGPIPKTYKYDPTKTNEHVIQAKRK